VSDAAPLVEAPPAAPLSREMVRSRRKRAIRAHTISVKRMTKRELELGRLLFPPDDSQKPRPRTRGDCAGVERPCPFISCQHHLYLDVSPRTGAIKLNYPDLEPDELPPNASCALDIADVGGSTLERVGELMNLTRERVRQVEVRALAKVRAAIRGTPLEDFVEPERRGPSVRRLPLLAEDDQDEDVDGDECLDRSGERPVLEDEDEEVAVGTK